MASGLGLGDEARYLVLASLLGFAGATAVWALGGPIALAARGLARPLDGLVPFLPETLATLASGGVWGALLMLGLALARGRRSRLGPRRLALASLSLGFALLGADALYSLLAPLAPALAAQGHVAHGALLGALYGWLLALSLRLDAWHLLVPLLGAGGALGSLSVGLVQDLPEAGAGAAGLGGAAGAEALGGALVGEGAAQGAPAAWAASLAGHGSLAMGFVLGLFAGYALFLADMRDGERRSRRWLPREGPFSPSS